MKKIVILIFCVLAVSLTHAQRKRKAPYGGNRANSTFLRTQWWLGFQGGVNFTQAKVIESFSSFAPVNYESSEIEKSYQGMLPGGQAGITVSFYHRGFSFVFEPSFKTQQFGYGNTYQWISEQNPDNSLELNYDHSVNMQYVQVPVYLRYDIIQGTLRPFVQFGGFYNRLINARKTIHTTGTDNASGSAGSFQDQEVTFGATDLFNKQNYGIAGGGGLSYDVWNVRFVLAVNYLYSMANVTNAENRYSGNPIADTGDVMDDLNLHSLDISINCVFPLRFISKDLKSTE